MKVYVSDIRACGLCLVPGAKNWCELHGIDWRTLIQEGIEISVLENIDDTLVQQVIAYAKGNRNG